MVTGVDLIKSQILIAQGVELADPEINLPSQDAVQTQGFAFQCRVTTEDPGEQVHARTTARSPTTARRAGSG